MENLILKIGPHQISNFISYRIDSDLYKPAAAFRLELPPTSLKISAGQLCELYINGSRELTGIADRVSKSVSKEGESLTIEGRDLMGLLIDSYCEKFDELRGITLKAVTEKLLAKIQHINTKNILYEKNLVGKMKTKKKSTSPLSILNAIQDFPKIDVGMTVFEALKTISFSLGLLFYCLPDGTFVYGRPKAGGSATFKIQLLKNGSGNNAIRGEVTDDISQRYSHVYVVVQQQNWDGPSKPLNDKIPAIDRDFPFYKPFVTQYYDNSMSASRYARVILEKMRRKGFHLLYEVARHGQNGINWKINELCEVNDEALDIRGTFLVYGRTFRMSKQNGPTTMIRLGLPGLVNIED